MSAKHDPLEAAKVGGKEPMTKAGQKAGSEGKKGGSTPKKQAAKAAAAGPEAAAPSEASGAAASGAENAAPPRHAPKEKAPEKPAPAPKRTGPGGKKYRVLEDWKGSRNGVMMKKRKNSTLLEKSHGGPAGVQALIDAGMKLEEIK